MTSMQLKEARGIPPRRFARTQFLDLHFDAMEQAEADAWLGTREVQSPFAYVVTPNVDHIVRLARADETVKQAYDQADLCLCDSRVLRRIARWYGVKLTVVTGSDLVDRLFKSILQKNDRVMIIGSSREAIGVLQAAFPDLGILHHAPPMNLSRDPIARAAAAEEARRAGARFILLAVGSPQQELIAAEMKARGDHVGTALCIGASIDFLTGFQTRAPRLVRMVGMEWAWRLVTDPRRLYRRYLIEGPAIFRIAAQWDRRRGKP